MKKLLILFICCLFVFFISCFSVVSYANNYNNYLYIENYEKNITANTKEVSFLFQNERYIINVDYEYFFNENATEKEYIAIFNQDNDYLSLLNMRIIEINSNYILEIILELNYKVIILNVDLSNNEFGLFQVNYDNYEKNLSKYEKNMINTFLKNSNFEGDKYNSSIAQTRSFDDLVLENDDDSGATGQSTLSYSWANDDKKLKEYNPYGRTSYGPNNKYKDDDITKVIPKHYFYTEGYHSIAGKEFGCYVLTTKYSEHYYKSLVYIYDIEVIKPGFSGITNSDYAYISIIPLFQHSYVYYTKDYIMFEDRWHEDVEEGYNSIVISNGAISSLKLRNIQMNVSIENKFALNAYENGYDASNDYGDFITNINCEVRGVGKESNPENFFWDTGKFIIGKIPYVGNLVETNSMINSLNQMLLNEVEPGNNNGDNLVDNIVFAITPTVYNNTIRMYESDESYSNEHNFQINTYNGLIKTATIIVDNTAESNENPILFGTNNNEFVKSKIKFNRLNSGTEYNYYNSEEALLFVELYSELVYDSSNESSINYDPSDDLQQLAINDTILNYGEYQKGCRVVKQNTNYESDVNIPGKNIYYKFIPNSNGLFLFQTTGNCDTYMYLYDDEGNLLSKNDDDGENRNALISYNLVQNKTYNLVIKLYNSAYTGTFNFNVTMDE